MKKFNRFFAFVFSVLILASCQHNETPLQNKQKNFDIRQDYFIMRSGSLTKQSMRRYETAISQVQKRQQSKGGGFQTPWTLEGPLNVSGRVNIIRLHPNDPATWLVGESTGGIFKTTDGGQTYTPVFDQFNHLAISELVYHPTNPDIVFAGTGDENISGYPFSGSGVYKSTDGGNTWQAFALQNTGIISTICIHPTHPDTMFVAAMGVPFYADSNRGVYRTYDGGNSWQQVLLPDTTAGVIDLLIDHNDPQTIYAVGWNRVRNNNISIAWGPQSQLYVSHNGGDTWQISNITGSSLPNSRIGIAQTNTANNRIYATVTKNLSFGLKGVYYSDNSAQTWQSINTQSINSIYMWFGWYFGQIRVNPYNPNKIYLLGLSLSEYNTQTSTWTDITALHVDNHDLTFLSEDSLIAATDGGLFLSANGGQTWSDIDNIPATQFYRVAFNPFISGEYWGGLQDNGTVKGNASSINNWVPMYGGDGFQTVFDRTNKNTVYMESQNGDLVYAQSGNLMGSYAQGIQQSDRRSWDMPVINDKNNTFYTGTFRVYKNTNVPYGNWSAVSQDITDSIASRYHVISALGVSEINTDFVYAGTSDGHVWRSTNAGNSWSEITHNLPDLYVTSTEASPSFADNVFVALSGYRDNNNYPHIFKSTDKGDTWNAIAGDLPDLSINAIVILPHQNDSIIFVATDGGVYGTSNNGQNWLRVGNNMPVIPVYDLVYDSLSRKLVAATYGRAMHSIAIDSLMPGLTIGINQPKRQSAIFVFPNPTHHHLFISTNIAEKYIIEIYNPSGQTVKKVKSERKDRLQIDLSDLVNGVYIIRIQTDNNEVVRKIIKI
jgi:photosystem II stability/assembly factor-like uncharacterized protein